MATGPSAPRTAFRPAQLRDSSGTANVVCGFSGSLGTAWTSDEKNDPGVLLKDPGILLKDPGVLLKDPGVL